MTRKLAAILVVDMVGYSRLMAADEAGTLARLKALRAELIDPEIASNEGRIVKAMGDGLLAVFDSVVGAVEAAAAVQKAMALNQAGVPPERRIAFRIGVHLGEVMEKPDGSIYGDGVNLAARLDSLLGLPAILEKAADCAKAAGTHDASERLADMVCRLLPSNGADGPGTERRAA